MEILCLNCVTLFQERNPGVKRELPVYKNSSLTKDCICILVSNEPKTYATLVKSGGTGVGMGSLGSAVLNPNVPAKPTTSPVS
jgi:hypothetical protein